MNLHRRREVTNSARPTTVTIAPPSDRRRRPSSPTLPGTPIRRPIVDVDAVPPTSIDAAAQLRRDLLVALKDGPLMKWELREQLHLPETIIVRQLRRLRLEGAVKVVGQVLDKRAWALSTWQRPTPVESPKVSRFEIAPAKKAKGPSDAWWARPEIQTWEDFSQAFRRRQQELGRENYKRTE